MNLTFVNGSADGGGAIANDGYCTIKECTFIGNTATDYGGAIANYELNCIVENCTFIDNIATSTRFGGGAICNVAGTLTVIGSTFINNTATYEGGAILNGVDCTANFNRFYGNIASTGSAVGNYGTMNAENNWWGSNADPTTIPNFIMVNMGSVDADPWLIMAYSANPTTIQQGGASALTADFRYDSNGIFHNAALGHLPDGAPLTFTTNLGNVGSKSIVIGTINGLATATLRGDEAAGEALISASLDNQTLTAIVTITPTNNVANHTSEVNAVSKTVNVSSKIIGMQETGIPLAGLILAILAVLGGLLLPKMK